MLLGSEPRWLATSKAGAAVATRERSSYTPLVVGCRPSCIYWLPVAALQSSGFSKLVSSLVALLVMLLGAANASVNAIAAKAVALMHS